MQINSFNLIIKLKNINNNWLQTRLLNFFFVSPPKPDPQIM